MATWHLPGGPAGPTSWWAATSKVGQTTYPVNRGRLEMEGREGREGQSHIVGQGRREWNGGGGTIVP